MKAIAILALLVAACSTTVTDTYERSALVPPPYVPDRSGAPLNRGDMRFAGGVNSFLASPSTVSGAAEDAPGLWMSRAQYSLSGFGALSDVVELGGFMRYAPEDGAVANRPELRPLAGTHDEMAITMGIGLRLNARFGESQTAFLSFLFDLVADIVPQTTWKNADSPETDAQTGIMPSLFVESGGRVTPWLTLYGLAGAEFLMSNTWKETITYEVNQDNLGEDHEPDATRRYLLVLYGLGAELRADPFYLNSAAFMSALGEDAVDFGPGLMLQAGVTL